MDFVFDKIETTNCARCGGLVDVVGQPAFTLLSCPNCKAEVRVPGKLGALAFLSGITIWLFLQSRESSDKTSHSQTDLKTSLPSGEELRREFTIPSEANTLITQLDKDKDGQLSLEEFTVAPTEERKEKLRNYFTLIDQDRDGSLSARELNRAYQNRP